jgi:hypothetical protein
LLDLGDLGGKGLGIGGVAVEHFDRHRASVGGARLLAPAVRLFTSTAQFIFSSGEQPHCGI